MRQPGLARSAAAPPEAAALDWPSDHLRAASRREDGGGDGGVEERRERGRDGNNRGARGELCPGSTRGAPLLRITPAGDRCAAGDRAESPEREENEVGLAPFAVVTLAQAAVIDARPGRRHPRSGARVKDGGGAGLDRGRGALPSPAEPPEGPTGTLPGRERGVGLICRWW
ncbi:unnamed protein product [Urochloa humidicola]